MSRRHWILCIAVAALLAGCGSDGSGTGGAGAPGPGGEGGDRLRQQAIDALARYDAAVLATGGTRTFVPVGDLTGQVGDWELTTGDDNKAALMSGRVVAIAALPTASQSTGTVTWDGGASHTFPLIPADEALNQVRLSGAGDCTGCVPLEVTGASLTTARIQTTRGPATAPAWAYTLKGTSVRLTRVAVASSAIVKVTPPSWDPYNAPGGLPIESATTTMSDKRLTVTFTGVPGPASQPCGADYTAVAVESHNAVVIIVNERHHATDEICTAIGARRTTTVDLAQPLGERAVLEVQQGLPVPVTITM